MNILPAASQSSFGPAQAEEKNHPSNEEIEESLESQTNLKEFKKNVEITGEQLIEFI